MTKTTKRITRRNFSAGGLMGLAALCLPRLSLGQGTANEGKNVSADTEKANMRVVSEFCAAFGRKDVDKVASLLADSCSYSVTQTRAPLIGKDKVMEQVKKMIGAANFKVLKTVALGPIVLNERDDTLVLPNTSTPRTIRVAAGMFFVDNGKIVEWTDYVIQ